MQKQEHQMFAGRWLTFEASISRIHWLVPYGWSDEFDCAMARTLCPVSSRHNDIGHSGYEPVIGATVDCSACRSLALRGGLLSADIKHS